ncbi:hypothetical protein [Candidatus Mycolicibacterium alkanivorans]|uniref:Uncharacterized protein n=1 Tax=Candidatus Mycolicibacterium alkanivorans TaxID=2954114 RepID=A0ABS9YUQ8_9MYCO|nr:hypothetical protein [Candidatus Mycolicibacterium alkanivorans]MCI4674980.1 hypothetical protein [Candidatus Mycolicibacterium alkanivorans]
MPHPRSGKPVEFLLTHQGRRISVDTLRYGRLLDETVGVEYERALTLAKSRIGPVLPQRTQLPISDLSGGGATDWKDTPTIKARLAGGYCLRTQAQGTCAYANICEHCPNFRTESTFLPILAAQRADAAALATDADRRGWGQ